MDISRQLTQDMAVHDVCMSDGANLHVKVLGDSSTSKPVLIALHGAPGFSDHTEPETTFGFLADYLKVIVYDARGSGVSELMPPYTNEQWISDVDEIRRVPDHMYCTECSLTMALPFVGDGSVWKDSSLPEARMAVSWP